MYNVGRIFSDWEIAKKKKKGDGNREANVNFPDSTYFSCYIACVSASERNPYFTRSSIHIYKYMRSHGSLPLYWMIYAKWHPGSYRVQLLLNPTRPPGSIEFACRELFSVVVYAILGETILSAWCVDGPKCTRSPIASDSKRCKEEKRNVGNGTEESRI